MRDAAAIWFWSSIAVFPRRGRTYSITILVSGPIRRSSRSIADFVIDDAAGGRP